ncbi:MAG: tetratricopeptide repeat protein [Pseudoxanthomonas sp.]
MEAGSGTSAGSPGAERYRFGDILVDAVAYTISRNGQPVAVEPKAFSVLLVLLRHAGQLVPRDELLDAVWGHRHVTPGVLTRAIAQLRMALDDRGQAHYIQTQHAVGYRFVGELVDEPGAVPAQPAEPPGAPAEAPAAAVETALVDVPPPGPVHASDRPWWKSPLPWLLAAALAVAWLLRDRFAERPAPAQASIAVMPFSNLGGNQDDDYFAEGLAVEMHDALAGVEGIKVAAQISSPAGGAGGSDVKALGRNLGVATVLDASVRREGQRVRINARLSDTSTGYTLWSHSYDRQLSDVFATQVEIANQVVQSLLGVLPRQGGTMEKRLTPTTNAAAFDAYLRGLQQLLQAGSGGDARGAITYFNQALSTDRKFSRAQAGICRAEVADFINRHDAAAFGRAQVSCERARVMDAGLGEVDLALAELHHADGEYGKAIDYYTKAQSDPASRPAAYVGIAIVHAEQGRDAQAMDYFNRALALRPGNARIHAQIGYRHFLAGRLPEAIASYRKAVELQPDDVDLWSYLGGVYLTAGKVPEAERALSRSISIKPGYAALTNLGEIKYLSGRYAEAVALQRRAVHLDPSDHTTWGNLAQALLADPATANQAPAAFQQAVGRAQRYVEIKSAAAMVVAARAWYQANLGQPRRARQLLARSEALGGEPGEVALYNAQTLVLLGEYEQARSRIAAARAAGIVDYRINGNPILRRAATGATHPGKNQAFAPNLRHGAT